MEALKTFEKNHGRIVFVLFVSIIISLSCIASAAHAQEPAASTGDQFDYKSTDSYSSADFYTKSDPAQWDYTQVKWDKVDYSNPKILTLPQAYSQQGFYGHLPADKYNQIDYKQVDYDMIKQENVDPTKYLQDMKCSNCVFSKDEGQQPKFSGSGISHVQDSVTIPGGYPAGTQFKATENGIEVVIPPSVAVADIPDQYLSKENRDALQKAGINSLPVVYLGNINPKDSFTVTGLDNNEVLYTDQDGVQREANQCSGSLSFKNSQMFVASGDSATIYGLKINADYGDVDVYFDGQKHKGDTSYVSLTTKTLDAGAGTNGRFTLDATNCPIVRQNFDYEKYYSDLQKENDQLIFKFKDKGDLQIENRGDKNQLSLVTGQDYYVTDGRKTYRVSGTEFVLQPQHIEGAKTGHGTIPIEIELSQKNQAVDFSNRNDFTVMSKADAAEINDARKNILDQRHINMYGFFKAQDLDNLDAGLFDFVDKNNIDLSKVYVKTLSDAKTQIPDEAQQFSIMEAGGTYKAPAYQQGAAIFLNREDVLNQRAVFVIGGIAGFGKSEQENTILEEPVHEFGHMLDHSSPDVSKEWAGLDTKYGITHTNNGAYTAPPATSTVWNLVEAGIPFAEYGLSQSSRGAFPSAYSSYHQNEEIAEYTKMMDQDTIPGQGYKWFDDPDTVNPRYIKGNSYVNFDLPAYQEFLSKNQESDSTQARQNYVIQIRQEKRGIIQKSIDRYKKDVAT